MLKKLVLITTQQQLQVGIVPIPGILPTGKMALQSLVLLAVRYLTKTEELLANFTEEPLIAGTILTITMVDLMFLGRLVAQQAINW
ncbi:MAG: hypothetical protein JKY53_10815 [Flavobacteriales bacterium]|nr:hypothetical protein [Flavobacteriales bacterium]